jgi:Transposase zinc-ribbon domain/ISXO2-like transposase domain
MLPSIPIQRAPGNPIAGWDYPRSRDEFEAFFPDEAACLAYLERLSWPDGFVCARCGRTGAPWRGSRRRLVCRSCGQGTTVIAGTLFQGTRTPLPVWFAAAWHVATADEGISARRLQRELALGSYETAWAMLHRLRRAMVRSGRPRLEGVVEVGRTFLPAGADRTVIAIAVEDRGQEPGRVRMQPLASSADAQLMRFVAWAVEPGTTVVPDRLRNPSALARLGCHPPEPKGAAAAGEGGGAAGAATAIAAAAGGERPFAHLRLVEGRLAEWLLRTHQGSTAPDLLDWYLDEFTFRFNRRSARHRGLLFYRLLEEALVTPPQPYEAMLAPRGGAARRQRGGAGRRRPV